MSRQVHTTDGIKGFYKGIGLSVSGVIAYRCLYYGLYDTGKHLLFSDTKESNILALWSFAQFVTLSTAALTYPIELVRTRLVMDAGNK